MINYFSEFFIIYITNAEFFLFKKYFKSVKILNFINMLNFFKNTKIYDLILE